MRPVAPLWKDHRKLVIRFPTSGSPSAPSLDAFPNWGARPERVKFA